MDAQNIPPNDADKSAVQLLQDINSGILNPKLIDTSSRQKCVELLIAEGYTYPQISQVLRCSEKTIARDVKKIQSQNALTPNVEFAKELIGELFQKAITHHSYLMRLARSKDGSLAEKAQCEFFAWRVLREMADKFQSLGYLPTMPRQLELMVNAQEDEQGLDDLKNKIAVIETTAKECGNLTPEVAEKINILKLKVEKFEAQEITLKLLDEQKSKLREKDEASEE